MGLHYALLTLAERRTSLRRLQARQSVTQVATLPGRHRSTIHREIARNFRHTAVWYLAPPAAAIPAWKGAPEGGQSRTRGRAASAIGVAG